MSKPETESYVQQYKEDRKKDLSPCPPVKIESVPDYDNTPVSKDVNEAAREEWVKQEYHADVPIQGGYTPKYGKGWDDIFGS